MTTEGTATPPMEFHIHAEIYRRRPKVKAVAHAHPLWSTVLGMAGHAVKPVIMQAAVLGEIRHFPRIASINNRELAQGMADALGTDTILKGLAVGGSMMAGAFVSRRILQRMTPHEFRHLIDALMIVSGLSMFWVAFR